MHILNQHLTLNYSCISAEPLCADLNRLFSVSSDAEIYVLGSYKKMADKRKLQGEIDRCTKKVSEGLETFEDLWKKVTTATNVNIKEKHEADLKKEIKKLQRFRDSIKSWLTNPEVKDKSLLIEHKRLIETKMEMFKVVERETKTKAYSKEGLTSQSKVDPKEKEKEDVNNWISQTIKTLKIQIDQFECQIENSTNRRKKVDKGKQGQLEHFREMLDKHKVHIEKLETIMRLLDNDALQLTQIQSIRDDVDYYSQSNQDDSFQENGFIYDDLNLDEISASLNATTSENVSGPNDDDHSSTVTFETNSSCSSPTIQPIHHPTHHPHNYHHHSGKEDNGKEKSETIANKSTFSASNHLLNKTLPARSLNDIPSTSTTPCLASSVVNYAQVASIGVSPNNIAPKSLSNSVKSSSNTFKQTEAKSLSPPSSPLLKHHKHHAQQQSPQILSQVNYSNHTPPSIQKKHFSSFDASIWKPKSLIEQSTIAMASSMLSSHNASNTQSPYSYVNSMNIIDDIPLTTTNKGYKSLLESSTTDTTSSSHTNTTSVKTFTPLFHSNSTSYIARPKSALLAEASLHNSSNVKSLTPTPLSTSVSNLDNNVVSCTVESLLPVDSNLFVSASGTAPTTTVSSRLNSQALSFSSVVSSLSFLPPTTSSYYYNSTSTTFDSTLLNTPSILSTSSTSTSLANYNLSQLLATSNITTSSSEPKTLHISPILAVTPLGPTLLNKQHLQQVKLLETASHHIPQAIDSSRIRAINSLPMPYKSPAHYTPLTPIPTNKLEFYLRLSPETLFYAFYYLEGSMAQLLAAKALKQLSWRFHKKLLIWFQRHEDPKLITEEYEQGSYLYFDFERWTQSTIETFVFEYRYLEDRDLH